jgi:hypothetical protein
MVKNYASNQVADVSPTRLKLRSLASRHLQFAAYQVFRVGDRINSRELQSQTILVRPQLFDPQLPPGFILSQRQKLQAHPKPAGDVTVRLD